MKNRQFAVIGLGRFGTSLLKELLEIKCEVLAIDTDEDKIEDIASIATHAITADSTDEQVLKALEVASFDAVVVAIGNNIQSNILTTILLKELGVNKIIAKAQNSLHGKVLEKIGADMVIYPERDMAIKLAHSLNSNNIMDHIELSSEFSILEIKAPSKFFNKNLEELELRSKFGITVLALKRREEIIISPDPGKIIKEKDILVLIGKNYYLNKISELH